MHKEIVGKRPSFFTINHWVTLVERAADQSTTTKAEVIVTANGEEITCSGESNGPVNAFDNELRTGLATLYSELSTLELTDYKVRILEGRIGTGALHEYWLKPVMARAHRTQWVFMRTLLQHLPLPLKML